MASQVFHERVLDSDITSSDNMQILCQNDFTTQYVKLAKMAAEVEVFTFELLILAKA